MGSLTAAVGSDPRNYFHSIRQWAVWAREKHYDREGFLDAFLDHTRRTFADAGQPWSDEIAEAVRRHGRAVGGHPGRAGGRRLPGLPLTIPPLRW